MIATPQYQTKVELVLRALRDGILTGELPAGYKLEINAVAAEFGMSPTPVREALRILQSDHLVDYVPHRGTVVSALSEVDLDEIFKLRGLLEPAAVADALERISDTDMERVEELHTLLLELPVDATSAFSDANRNWHWALYDLADSPLMTDFLNRLWEAFPWRAIAAVEGRRSASVAEHEAVMQALRTRDATAAVEAMRTHVFSSRAFVLHPRQVGVITDARRFGAH